MLEIVAIDCHDIRFPTSLGMHGSDAMHKDPDYSAAYVVLRTNSAAEGHGFAFTLGPSLGTTVTTGIYRSIGQYQQDFGAVFAFMFLATLPVLIFFLALQKHFVKGLTGGATKG